MTTAIDEQTRQDATGCQQLVSKSEAICRGDREQGLGAQETATR